MRIFESGAIRDNNEGKLDFEGALSPQVLYAFATYMEKHSHTSDGERTSDNWQKGFPEDELMKSLMRHVVDLWMLHRGCPCSRPETLKMPDWFDALGGAFFNLQAIWLEKIKEELS
jgi:hypothetical protein